MGKRARRAENQNNAKSRCFDYIGKLLDDGNSEAVVESKAYARFGSEVGIKTISNMLSKYREGRA